jgi:hypothetical protein
VATRPAKGPDVRAGVRHDLNAKWSAVEARSFHGGFDGLEAESGHDVEQAEGPRVLSRQRVVESGE